MATGDAKSAEREFREAVRINPAVAEYRAKLAALVASRGALQEAAWDAKAAVEADPDLAPARLLLGQLLLAGGDAQGGIRELEAAIRLKPDSGRAHYELGVALARSGNRAGAIEHLRIAAQGPDAGREGRGGTGVAQSRAVELEPESQLQGQDARSALARERADVGVGVPESSGGSGNTVGR